MKIVLYINYNSFALNMNSKIDEIVNFKNKFLSRILHLQNVYQRLIFITFNNQFSRSHNDVCIYGKHIFSYQQQAKKFVYHYFVMSTYSIVTINDAAILMLLLLYKSFNVNF